MRLPNTYLPSSSLMGRIFDVICIFGRPRCGCWPRLPLGCWATASPFRLSLKPRLMQMGATAAGFYCCRPRLLVCAASGLFNRGLSIFAFSEAQPRLPASPFLPSVTSSVAARPFLHDVMGSRGCNPLSLSV